MGVTLLSAAVAVAARKLQRVEEAAFHVDVALLPPDQDFRQHRPAVIEHQRRAPARLQHAVHLAHCPPDAGCMMQHPPGIGEVESAILERKPLRVGLANFTLEREAGKPPRTEEHTSELQSIHHTHNAGLRLKKTKT